MKPDQLTTWNNKNILKIKSDPLREVEIHTEKSEDEKKDTPESLRKEIEPWLTALFQSEHLSLLLGTGITNAVHMLATGKLPQGMSMMNFNEFKDQIETCSKLSASKARRGTPNIEDQIRVSNNLIEGMKIFLSGNPYGAKKLYKELSKFQEELRVGLMSFARDVLKTENNIAISKNLEISMEYMTNFLVSFCSRSATRERLNLFTTPPITIV